MLPSIVGSVLYMKRLGLPAAFVLIAGMPAQSASAAPAAAAPTPCFVSGPEEPKPALKEYQPVASGRPLWRVPPVAAEVAANGDFLRVTLPAQTSSTFVLHRPVDDVPSPVRAEFSVRLEGWRQVDYLAVGWMEETGRFVHERVKHVMPGEWLQVAVDPESVAFQLVNGWSAEPEQPERLRIVVKGTPGREARLDVGPVHLSLTGRFAEYPLRSPDCVVTRASLHSWLQAIRGRPPRLDAGSFVAKEVEAIAVARALRERGEYRLTDLPPFSGDEDVVVPAGALATTTSRFRWHSLDIVVPLIQAFRISGEEEYLALARREAERWLAANLDRKSADLKYAWYDHGTANRTVALVLLWEQGVERGFDAPFMERLFLAVHAHAELLASPSFYLRNQPVRFHNHAVFQDLALLAAARVLSDIPAAEAWRSTAADRLVGQFDALVTDEGASVENSGGYHLALSDLCEQAVERLESVRLDTSADSLEPICRRMDVFTRAMRYPDGRAPAFGDTWRRPYGRLPAGDLASEKGSQFFPQSGYAVLRGGAVDGAIQINVFNSSLTLTHKHNDFLSFTVWYDGAEWLIDPGFHSYSEDPHAEFAPGATAHNTILPCGRSFTPATDVTSLSPEVVGPGESVVTADYRPRRDLTIRRRFEGRFDSGLLVIEDEIIGDCGGADSEIWFQLDDAVTVGWAGDSYRLRRQGSGEVLLSPPSDAECDLYRGQLEPFIAGWYYPSFGQENPTSAIRCRIPAERRKWRTTLVMGSGSDDGSRPAPCTAPSLGALCADCHSSEARAAQQTRKGG